MIFCLGKGDEGEYPFWRMTGVTLVYDLIYKNYDGARLAIFRWSVDCCSGAVTSFDPWHTNHNDKVLARICVHQLLMALTCRFIASSHLSISAPGDFRGVAATTTTMPVSAVIVVVAGILLAMRRLSTLRPAAILLGQELIYATTTQ